jgi:hypothetical protein
VTVVGSTASSNFPATPSAFDSTFNGNIFGFGLDGFVTRINASGSSLDYSTFLGGTSDDGVKALALDPAGAPLVAGFTVSTNFPTTPGAFDTQWTGVFGLVENAFMSRLNVTGSSLVYSTYLSGSGVQQGVFVAGDRITTMDIDPSGTLAVAGTSFSTDFPVTVGAYDTVFDGPQNTAEGFVARFRPGPTLTFNGTPAPGNLVNYTISSAAPTGAIAQVVLSCSGTAGHPLPGGLSLPLTTDACTMLGLAVGGVLRGLVDTAGIANTLVVSFPAVSPGTTIYSAAFTWSPVLGHVFAVTPAILYVTQ